MEHIAEIERRELYRSQGYSSTAEWVANTNGEAYGKSVEKVDVAVSLSKLPRLKEAFREGRLSYDHLRFLIKVIDDENEEKLIGKAEGLSVAATRRLVKKHLKLKKEDSREARSDRWLEIRQDDETRSVYFFGQFPEELGKKFTTSIDLIAQTMPDDPLLGRPSPMGTKRADALMALVDSDLTQRGPKAQLVVDVDGLDFSENVGVAQILGGPAVPMETARRLSCDSMIRVIVRGASGEPIAVTRNRRTPDFYLEQLIYIRADGKCEAPTCNQSKNLSSHHIEHWEDEGPTSYENLVLLCPHHHYLVHEGGYQIVGTPPKITLVRGDRPEIKIGPEWISKEAIGAFDLEFAVEIEAAGRGP